jgi:S1-C subfamily serine protease
VRASFLLGILLGLFALGLPSAADGSDALDRLEDVYRRASSRARNAAVLVVPRGGSQQLETGSSSGVLVSPDGLVFSDGDAGLRWRRVEGREEAVKTHQAEVHVRLRAADGRMHAVPGLVLQRDPEADTSLIRLLRLPPGGVSWVALGRSRGLRPGAFLLAAGTAFEERIVTPATVTAGILASSDPGPTPGGPRAFLYTTAAVNQGVNGGPVVDLDGRLVGTVSTWVDVAPDAPHQMLGRVVPVDRIRRIYASRPEARRLTPSPPPSREVDDPARALETTIVLAATRAGASVVSLEIERARRISPRTPVENGPKEMVRWRGPVSGVLVDRSGWIVTSLYNVTNVGQLVFPAWRPPAGAGVHAGLGDVRQIRAWLPGGGSASARVVSFDTRLGIVLMKVDAGLLASSSAATPRPADAGAYRPGRFVVTAGNPFGADRTRAPIVTAGILSKRHAPDTAAAWRGTWQTDAPGLDVNCGGAAVDLEGRMLGMLQLWHPSRHGRGSGVAFVVPWQDILEALPRLKQGRRLARGLLGVRFARGTSPRVASVVAGSGAEAAGFRTGDIIHRIDRERITCSQDVGGALGFRYAGETVEVQLERGGTMLVLSVVLGARTP